MSDVLIINGARYVTHDCLSFGDYGGAGSIGRANVEALREQFGADCAEGYMSHAHYNPVTRETLYDTYRTPELEHGETPALVILSGYPGAEQAYIREDHEAADEVLGALENYCSLDDDRSTEIEMEWEEEAWRSYVERDLYLSLPDSDDAEEDGCEDLQAKADMMPDCALWDCYRAAMESTNTYPVAEHNGVAIDIDRIAEAYAEQVAAYDFGLSLCFCPSLEEAQRELPF